MHKYTERKSSSGQILALKDFRNNTAEIEFFGSLEKAIEALDSLTSDCRKCVNCVNCEACLDCVNCRDCYHCNYCNDCAESKNLDSCRRVSRSSECNHCTDCKDCHHCIDCKDCNHCRHCLESNSLELCEVCHSCTDCKRCDGCVNCDGLSDTTDTVILGGTITTIPVIENIHQKLLDVLKEGCELDMSDWHTCETTHCRAGWITHMAGEAGRELEEETNTPYAAYAIYRASSPIEVSLDRFFDEEEEAMEDIIRCAELEKQLNDNNRN